MMARIKIEELPEDMKVSKEELRKVKEGILPDFIPRFWSLLADPRPSPLIEQGSTKY